MSIGFRFVSKVTDRMIVDKALERLSKKFQYVFYRQKACDILDFCCMGQMYFYFDTDRGLLNADCQTSLAGAGFHAFAIDFVDAFCQQTGLEIFVDDATEYYTHRNFYKMREEHFYQWLRRIIDVIKECQDKDKEKTIRINWPLNTYQPENIPGTIITPMGRFTIEGLLDWVSKNGVEAFAKEFYIWNEKIKDARFYRNSALNIMWEKCFFMPAERDPQDAKINQAAIHYLEKAAKMDALLPFPKMDYAFLCMLNECEMIDIKHLPDYKMFDKIGYRKEMVYYTLGNLVVPIHGSYFEKYDEKNHGQVYYNAEPKDWRSISLMAVQYKNKPAFDNEFLQGHSVIEQAEFVLKDAVCQSAYLGEQKKDGIVYYQTVAQIISDKQMTYITVNYAMEEEKEWAMLFLTSIKANLNVEED